MPRFDPRLLKFLEGAPIFHQPWWLEVATHGGFDYSVAWRGEEVAAVLPYRIKRKFGHTLSKMPEATPYLGPWFRPSTAKLANRLSEEKDLINELVKGLPPFAFFHQSFHPLIQNWQPFHWHGFSQSSHITYWLDDTSDPDRIWTGTRDNIRTDVKKARKAVEVREHDGFGLVLEMHKKTLARQGKTFPHTDDFMLKLDAAAKAAGLRKIFAAFDAQNRCHAVAYFLWDQHAVYYYTSGADPELRNSGAGTLLLWQGILLANQLGRPFDFEGSMHEPIERFFRSFGGRQISIPIVQKTNSRLFFAKSQFQSWKTFFKSKRKPVIDTNEDSGCGIQ